MLFFTSIFDRFFVDFGVVLEGLGEVLGCIWLSIMGPQTHRTALTVRTLQRVRFLKDLGRVWGGSWEGLGTILGGFWQGLGAFWSILCNFTCFGPVRLRVGGFEPLGVLGFFLDGKMVPQTSPRFSKTKPKSEENLRKIEIKPYSFFQCVYSSIFLDFRF